MRRLTLFVAVVVVTVCPQPVHPAPAASIPKPAFAVYAPKPKYPILAGLRGAHGGGIFVMRVQIKTGLVKQVDVAQSTGHRDLDAAAVSALKQWRFKPDTLTPIKKIAPQRKDPFSMEDSLIKVPVTFSNP